jgi:hypothetical protein
LSNISGDAGDSSGFKLSDFSEIVGAAKINCLKILDQFTVRDTREGVDSLQRNGSSFATGIPANSPCWALKFS